MATEQHSVQERDLSQEIAQLQLMQRGRELLRQLQQAARAARLEVQAMELQAALTLAEQGDATRLATWLDRFTSSPSVDPQPSFVFVHAGSPVADEVPAPTCAEAGSKSFVPEPSFDDEPEPVDNIARSPVVRSTAGASAEGIPIAQAGWEPYLSGARQRLQSIEREKSGLSPWCDHNAPQVVSVELRTDHAAQDKTWPVQIEGSATLAEVPPEDVLSIDDLVEGDLTEECLTDEEPTNEGLTEEALTEEALRELKDCAGPSAAEAVPAAPYAKRLFGSYGMSIVGHAIVLAILGTMTYQAEPEGNSLGSQVLSAAEARSEVELSSDVEVLEPAELELSEPVLSATEPQTLATELSQLSQAVSPVSVDVTAVDSAGASLASAITAATRQPPSSASRGGGTPSMSGKFFGVGTGGNYFCYVVDRSGSMRGGAWESAKAELLRSLKSLKSTQKFYVIFFADEFEALPEPGSDQPASSGLYATTENIEHARKWIQSVELNRGGPPNEALVWAIDREPDAIYLLTDGVTKVDVCGHLRKVNRLEDIVSGTQVRVPIHAIAYHSLEGQHLMRQLAKENQGQFIYVPKPKK